MNDDRPHTVIVGAGQAAREIVALSRPAETPGKPGLFWISGFMSDMNSTKGTAVADWAGEHGHAATRFDVSGTGRSAGDMSQGTIGRWIEEAEAVFLRLTEGPQIVIGSSMGGHIALMLLKRLMRADPDAAARIAALVLIAPAWDMTEELMWKRFPEETRRAIIEEGAHRVPSAYDAPYLITRDLIEDGRRHLLARAPFDPGRPVVIIQGLLDEDVPPAHTRELLTFMTGDRVKLIEIADAGHRLSRPQDLAVLFAEIEKLL